MRRLSLFVCGFALFSAAPLSAQQTIRTKQILPKEFRSWHVSGCVNQLTDTKADDSRLWKEAGLRNLNKCEYSSDGKTVLIFLAQYADPSSAFEVYTSWLRPGMMPAKLGQVAAFDKEGVLIQEGSLVLSSSANISREDLAALVQAVEANSENTTPLPPVRMYLPTEGRLVGSERYALGPEALMAALMETGQRADAGFIEAMGFNNGGEAMLARYSQPGKGTGVLLLLEYPTPQLAEQHIHHIDEVIPAAARQAGMEIERKGSLLSMVLTPSSAEYAKNLREAANYETQVTWNEAGQAATDPPITSTLVKIIMGTGVFMVAALVLGVAFGGVRVVTKRFFPGKVFDRPNQMEVLQLGLSGKRIDPTDFY